MKTINVNEKITSLKGTPIPSQDENGNPKDLTIGDVLINSLMAVDPKEQIDGRKKIKRYKLASKLTKSESIDLGAEDIILIKECVAKAYTPLVMGKVYEWICPEELEKDE